MIAHATSLKNQVSALLYARGDAMRSWRTRRGVDDDTLCAVCPSATTKAPYALNTETTSFAPLRAGQPLRFEILARCDQTPGTGRHRAYAAWRHPYASVHASWHARHGEGRRARRS